MLYLVLWAPIAHGGQGNELYAIGAVQKGMGGAGVASPQDASWALLNPAALVDLDRRFDLSLELLRSEIMSEPRGCVLAANPFAGEMIDHNWIVIPSGGLVLPQKKGVLSLGIYAVGGNQVEFDAPRTTLSLLVNGDRRTKYQMVALPLAYGRRLDSGWAVGASLVPVVTRLSSDSLTLRLRRTEGDKDWDNAFGLGFRLGLYRRWARWSLGLTYQSPTWMQRHNEYRDLFLTSFDHPQQIRAGLAYRPVPKLEFVLDYQWIDWTGIPLTGNKTVDGGMAWRDQHLVRGGVTWDVNERWGLRAGASYGRAPIGEDAAFVNALSPGLSEWHLAVGATYRLSAHTEIHASFSHAIPEKCTDDGSGDLFSVLGRGSKIGYAQDSVTVQYSYLF